MLLNSLSNDIACWAKICCFKIIGVGMRPASHLRLLFCKIVYVQYTCGTPAVLVRLCSTREAHPNYCEENFFHLQFIKSHSMVLQMRLTGTAHRYESCTYFMQGDLVKNTGPKNAVKVASYKIKIFIFSYESA